MPAKISRFFVLSLLTILAVAGFGFILPAVACDNSLAPPLFLSPAGVQGPICTTEKQNTDMDLSDWKTFKSEKYGFRFQYPPDGEVRTSKSSDGKIVKLNLPFTEGTLLQEKLLLVKTGKDLEQFPVYSSGDKNDDSVFINGREFAKKVVKEGAAGHKYEHMMYLTYKSTRYFLLDFVLGSTNPGMYESPPPDFGRNEADVFSRIASTFRFLD